MSLAHVGSDGGRALEAAIRLLSLAAAPTFAVMALLAGSADAGAGDMLCAAAQHASPINGMAVMYALMAAFHSAPWLKLIFSRSLAGRRA